MRYEVQGWAHDGQGNSLASVQLNVYLAGTTTAATLYETEAAVAGVASITTGADGSWSFWVDDTDYPTGQLLDVVFSLSGYTGLNASNINPFYIDFASAQTLTNKTFVSATLTSPTVSGGTLSSPTLSGTVAGSPTFSGVITFSSLPVSANDPTTASQLVRSQWLNQQARIGAMHMVFRQIFS